MIGIFLRSGDDMHRMHAVDGLRLIAAHKLNDVIFPLGCMIEITINDF